MRALLRDSGDGTLYCVQVLFAYYRPEDRELVLETGEGTVTVSEVETFEAEPIIRSLYNDGRADLTHYPSEF